MNRETLLRRRIRGLTWFVIVGLVLSGATAIPLMPEVDWLAEVTGAAHAVQTTAGDAPAWALWLVKVRDALHDVDGRYPFLFYGTDWLALGHFAIAIAFIGALRDPVRNRWLYTFGTIVCAVLVPYALVFGGVRGIPVWWRIIDCSFGVVAFVPLWLCCRWAREIEKSPAATVPGSTPQESR